MSLGRANLITEYTEGHGGEVVGRKLLWARMARAEWVGGGGRQERALRSDPLATLAELSAGRTLALTGLDL